MKVLQTSETWCYYQCRKRCVLKSQARHGMMTSVAKREVMISVARHCAMTSKANRGVINSVTNHIVMTSKVKRCITICEAKLRYYQ